MIRGFLGEYCNLGIGGRCLEKVSDKKIDCSSGRRDFQLANFYLAGLERSGEPLAQVQTENT